MAIVNLDCRKGHKFAYNSWGKIDKMILINDTQESAKFFCAKWSKIVKKDANKRQDEEVYLQK